MAPTTARSASRKPAPAAAEKSGARRPKAAPRRLVVLVATRKGAWLFHGDAQRKTWTVDGPHFLGHTITHLQLDPRDGRTLLAAAKTGHLGPTIFRSTDFGRRWKEAAKPPVKRVKTRMPLGAKKRRLEGKKHRSAVKSLRQRKPGRDD